MILSDSEIKKRMELAEVADVSSATIRQYAIIIKPPPPDQALQPASVDLHLASDFKSYSPHNTELSVDEEPYYDNQVMGVRLTLKPGEFIIGSTVEWIEVPYTCVARVEGKSSLGRLGLIVHATAGFIDPGYRGNITLELKNINRFPFTLQRGMAISQLCFEQVAGTVDRPYGSKGLGSRYQDSRGSTGARKVKPVV